MADRLNPTVDSVQSADGEAAVDRAVAGAECPELGARDHSMLARRKLGDTAVLQWGTASAIFAPHMSVKVAVGCHAAMLTTETALLRPRV